MAKKLTEKTLAKKLDTMSKEELEKIIIEFYKINKSVEEGLSLMLLGEEYGNALLEKYKKQLYKIFNPSNIVRTDFTMCYGDIDEDFYEALGDAYHDAVIIAREDEQLYKFWKDRMECILHDFSGLGWGMDDFISEEYYSIPWIEEE